MVFPIDSEPYNLTYEKWIERWWQWVISIPKDINPLTDSTGEHCCEGQGGDVWFLVGTTGKVYSAERKCTIPSGKAVLFPIIVSEFSFAEMPFITTDEELISYTAKDIDMCSLLEATVDGVNLRDLQKHRVQQGPFNLYIPNDNVWNVRPGNTKAISDGYWILLKPLSSGDHFISFHGIEPHFETEVKYTVSIKSH